MPAADTLTVADCVALARRYGPAVKAAALDAEAARLDSVATSFNRRPEFALGAGATLAPAWAYDPAYTNLGEYHAQASADWTLADGGRRLRDQLRAGLGLATARAHSRLESREAGQAAAQRALRLLRLDEVEASQREAADELDRIGTLVAAGVRAGARSPADSIRLALARADAAIDLESTAGERRTVALELHALMGWALRADFPVRDPGAGSLLGPGERDSLALLAATQRAPEVTLAAVAHQQAALDASDARQRDAGTLGLTVDAGLAGTDLTRAVPAALLDTDPNATFADRLRRDLGASAALTWRLPLFDRARAPAAAARLAAANAAWARHESEIEFAQRDALSLLAQWRTAGRRLEATAIIVARAEVHYLRTKSLYAAGATTLFDLLDALQLHRDASIRLADAREEIRFLRFRAEDRP